jgi:hypothetical protein
MVGWLRTIIPDFKDFLSKGEWFVVLGDLECISRFVDVFYPDGLETGEFIVANVIMDCGDERGRYKSIVPVFMARKKESLRETLGKDFDGLMSVEFEKDENGGCKPYILKAGRFTRWLVTSLIIEKLKRECRQSAGVQTNILLDLGSK